MEDNLKQYVDIALMVVSVASAIAAVTPTKADNVVIDKILSVINLLAINVGKAKRK